MRFFSSHGNRSKLGEAALPLTFFLLVLQWGCTSNSAAEATWVPELKNQFDRIEASGTGNLGVYIKRLSDRGELSFKGDRQWYLASTTKVPVAIVLLKKVEKGDLALDQKLTLKKSDYVDGSGELLNREPGEQFTVHYLLNRMLTQSDSTATDMLIRLIGVQALNSEVQKMAPQGFGPLTTILQVRYDAYSEIHPGARKFDNFDFLELKRSRSLKARYSVFLKKLKVKKTEAREKSIQEAFERYYQTGSNSATLESYGALLEKLVEGKLLSAQNTQLILDLMTKMTTGETRIKAGLPGSIEFAQKTGTQVGRICNVGILSSRLKKHEKAVIAACVEKFSQRSRAEKMLKEVGKAVADSVFLSESKKKVQL